MKAKYHVAEIIENARIFVRQDHVEALLAEYGVHADVEELEQILFSNPDMLFLPFPELWPRLQSAHTKRRHVFDRWQAFVAERPVHFGGRGGDLISSLVNTAKRVFGTGDNEDDNSAFSDERIAEYNAPYALLHNPDTHLVGNPVGAYFPAFAQAFDAGTASPESRTSAARAAVIRIIKGEALMSDYQTFLTMNARILEDASARGETVPDDNLIDPLNVIDILQKLVFTSKDVSVSHRVVKEISAVQLAEMNFRFQQVHNTERSDYVFDGEDVNVFLRNDYNLNQSAKRRKIEFDDYLGRLKGIPENYDPHTQDVAPEFDAYLERQYGILKRIFSGTGTRADYVSLSAYGTLSEPLKLLDALVVPKADLAIGLQHRKIAKSIARKGLTEDVATGMQVLEKIDTERELMISAQNRKKQLAFDALSVEPDEQIKTLIARFVSSIKHLDRSSDVGFKNVNNFYKEQMELSKIVTGEIVGERNLLIRSIFNSVLYIRSLRDMREIRVTTSAPKNPLLLIYEFIYDITRVGNGRLSPDVDDTSLVRMIYYNLLEISKEKTVSVTNNFLVPLSQKIDFIVNDVEMEIDSSIMKPSRAIQNVYMDVEKIANTLIEMLRTMEFDAAVSKESLYDTIHVILPLYKVFDIKQADVVNKDKHFLVELVVKLLEFEKADVYPEMINEEQYLRLGVAEQNITLVFNTLHAGRLRMVNPLKTKIEDAATVIQTRLHALKEIVLQNTALYTKRFRGVVEFFVACTTYVNYDSVQTYADIHNRYELDNPDVAEIVFWDEDNIVNYAGVLAMQTMMYAKYLNEPRAVQVLSWMQLYVEETIADLQKAGAALRQPVLTPPKITLPLLARKLRTPSAAEMAAAPLVYKSTQEAMADSMANVMEHFDRMIVRRGGANPRTFLLYMAKLVVYVGNLTVETPQITLDKIMGTIDFSAIDLSPLVINIDDNGSIFTALLQAAYALNDAQQQIVKAFAAILFYNMHYYANEDFTKLTVKKSVANEIDYALRDTAQVPSGSTAEFMMRWDAFMAHIATVKNQMYPQKNQQQINNAIMWYVHFMQSEFYGVGMAALTVNTSNETLALELSDLKAAYYAKHTPENQLKFTNAVERAAINILPFFRNNEALFDREPKLPNNNSGIDVDFTVPYINITSVDIRALAAEYQRRYVYHVNGVLVSYFTFLTSAINRMSKIPPITIDRFKDVLRKTSVPVVETDATPADVNNAVEKLLGALQTIESFVVNTYPLSEIAATMLAIKMREYFNDYGVLSENDVRTFTISMDLQAGPVLETTMQENMTRFYNIANYLEWAYGAEKIRPIVWRYAVYLQKLVEIVQTIPDMRSTDKVIDIATDERWNNYEFGVVPEIKDIHNTVNSIIAGIFTCVWPVCKELVYIVASKMEMFVERTFQPPATPIHFGTRLKKVKTTDIFDLLRTIEPIDLQLIMMHYAQCTAIGRAIVALQYDVVPEPSTNIIIPKRITAIPDNLNVAAFVDLLIFNGASHHDAMMSLLVALTTVLSEHQSAALHESKWALKYVNAPRRATDVSSVRWIVSSTHLVPIDALPAERVVVFLSECIFLLTSISPPAFAAYHGKQQESIFLGLAVSS